MTDLELSIAARASTHNAILAYLIQAQAKSSNKKLDAIYQSIASDLIKSCSGLPEFGIELETKALHQLDSIFMIAGRIQDEGHR
jgi:hypothetical protein